MKATLYLIFMVLFLPLSIKAQSEVDQDSFNTVLEEAKSAAVTLFPDVMNSNSEMVQSMYSIDTLLKKCGSALFSSPTKPLILSVWANTGPLSVLGDRFDAMEEKEKRSAFLILAAGYKSLSSLLTQQNQAAQAPQGGGRFAPGTYNVRCPVNHSGKATVAADGSIVVEITDTRANSFKIILQPKDR